MAKAILENSLEVEQDDHLGYEKWDQDAHSITDNSRKGYTSKTIKSKYGEFDINVPRDRNGIFEPKIVKKYQTDILALDDKIISLYAKGSQLETLVKLCKICMALKLIRILFLR